MGRLADKLNTVVRDELQSPEKVIRAKSRASFECLKTFASNLGTILRANIKRKDPCSFKIGPTGTDRDCITFNFKAKEPPELSGIKVIDRSITFNFLHDSGKKISTLSETQNGKTEKGSDKDCKDMSQLYDDLIECFAKTMAEDIKDFNEEAKKKLSELIEKLDTKYPAPADVKVAAASPADRLDMTRVM